MANEVNNITAGYTKVFDLVDSLKTETGETRAITKQEAAELKTTVQSWANDLKSYQLSVPSGQVNGQMAMAAEKLIGELSTALSNINLVGSLTNGTLSGSLLISSLEKIKPVADFVLGRIDTVLAGNPVSEKLMAQMAPLMDDLVTAIVQSAAGEANKSNNLDDMLPRLTQAVESIKTMLNGTQEGRKLTQELNSLIGKMTNNAGQVADAEDSSNSIADGLALIVLLYTLSKLSRQQQVQQREIAVDATVTSQKNQADEQRSAAWAMIGMAIVAGVMAGLTVAAGAFGAFQSGKKIGKEMSANAQVNTQQKGMNQVDELLQKTDLPEQKRTQLLKAKEEGTKNLTEGNQYLQTNNHKFDRMTGINQALTAFVQTLGQFGNAIANYSQAESQARSKEDEVQATQAQAEKQKADENVSFQEGLLKELRDLFRSIADSENQAWRASAPTV
ncbi:type III secretion system translocon subunit SctB [Vibrio sp. VPAP30]|uniref:type III secretion system translocon subunit SctB n=1 Tax=Vibrio sp. VPAP30 TaxID=1647102 RepID=UPI000658E489|nr:type III secretion system translocon subunit SctB [Vibrio sp. VPAP30]KLN64736.1 hypothetical protein ZX61_12830 [Vibrio sp. VPAP30]